MPKRGVRVKGSSPISINLFRARVARIATKHKVDTQRIREYLIHELESLADNITKRAVEAEDELEKAEWMRIIAYINQVLNNVAKAYEEREADEMLKELERMLKELKEGGG